MVTSKKNKLELDQCENIKKWVAKYFDVYDRDERCRGTYYSMEKEFDRYSLREGYRPTPEIFKHVRRRRGFVSNDYAISGLRRFNQNYVGVEHTDPEEFAPEFFRLLEKLEERIKNVDKRKDSENVGIWTLIFIAISVVVMAAVAWQAYLTLIALEVISVGAILFFGFFMVAFGGISAIILIGALWILFESIFKYISSCLTAAKDPGGPPFDEYDSLIAAMQGLAIEDIDDVCTNETKNLLRQLKEGRLSGQGESIDLSVNRLNDIGVEALAAALEGGNCPLGLKVYLFFNHMTDNDIARLAAVLSSGEAPKNLQLYFSFNAISDTGIQALANAIVSNKLPEGTYLGLAHCNISEEGIIELANALQSVDRSCKLGIDLSGNKITDKVINTLVGALESGKCPAVLQLTLDLTNNSITDSDVKRLIKALQHDNCPYGLRIDFPRNSVRDMQQLALAIRNGKLQYIGLSHNNIGHEDMVTLVGALKIGRYNADLQLNLSDNKIGNDGIAALIELLSDEDCPARLNIDLSRNNITANGFNRLVMALGGSRPRELQINLSGNSIPMTNSGLSELLLQALLSNTSITSLELGGINSNNFTHKKIQFCLIRNKLIQQCNDPLWARYIKRKCYELDLYQYEALSENVTIPLKFLASQVVSAGEHSASQDIPQDIRQFLDALKEFDRNLKTESKQIFELDAGVTRWTPLHDFM